MIDVLLSAFLLSVVLLGIHSFFGLEIIRRGIIFTDLAIGQMSALGAAVSLFFFHGGMLYPVSLFFALAAGLMITMASRRTAHLEAFIGLLYAFGISGVVILLSKSSHGMELFQKLMASDILFTPMEEILAIGAVYAGIGTFLFFFYRKAHGMVKDILFFVTFAATVTSSVKMAGVLIVFALLVAPAFISIRLGVKRPLVTAWAVGTAVNIAAIVISYEFDFPTGYAIVFAHALLAIAVVLFSGKQETPEQKNVL